MSTGIPAKALSTTPNSAMDIGTRKLRLATMNILADCFPWFVRLAIASEDRFEALCREVEQLDATIVAMNEVTESSLEKLLANNFVRSNYYVAVSLFFISGIILAR